MIKGQHKPWGPMGSRNWWWSQWLMTLLAVMGSWIDMNNSSNKILKVRTESHILKVHPEDDRLTLSLCYWLDVTSRHFEHV